MIDNNINTILSVCAAISNQDAVLIISDEKTFEIGARFYEIGLKTTANIKHLKEKSSNIPGASEPSTETAKEMLKSTLIISLLTSSIAHTEARYSASNNGARFLSLPDYSFSLLERDSIDVDYLSIQEKVDHVASLLTETEKVCIETEKGTKLTLVIKNRIGNSCPCIVRKGGDIGSPPDIEANIAIVEDETNGTFVVDGSIACQEIGLLEENVIVEIKNGKIISFESEYSEYSKLLNDIFNKHSSMAKVPAELGFGFNKKAILCGIMLEDEGCFGTIHIGFGSNSTIGGKNKVPFHLDMIIKEPTVYFDNKKVLDKGDYII